ncbi:MAG TPA: gamma-glutamyl-gamma-aminobutyrate hydrolase family protein [Burkholderiaceae bacterium]|nr:gamma-glutamyl-gamma-aminobutyrate hydrolase family protein [Burkholderiaceae bacterium]
MSRPRIGISACFMHPDPERGPYAPKTLHYVEQSVAHWVASAGTLPYLIPSPYGETRAGDLTLADYADDLDGLVLEGGADLWPGSYRESPARPEWSGDRIRDEYELELVHAFEARGKPVLGLCRGLQLINVAFGGSLHQDIATHVPRALRHRDHAAYDLNFHDIEIVEGSRLAQLYPGCRRARVNSVHHQAIKALAPGFDVEAVAPDDGVIEAIRRRGGSYVAAVQWHPEWHRRADAQVLPGAPLLQDFVAVAARGRRADA